MWLLLLTLVVGYSSCSESIKQEPSLDQEQNDQEEQEDPNWSVNGRYLVIYASRSGNTENVAHQIQSTLNCDILEVEPITPYESDYNSMLTRAEQELNNIRNGNYPSIKTNVESFDEYDMIFVGYPIWHGHMATPMQTFLYEHADKLSDKRIALFATSGSSGISTSVNEAQSLCTNSTFTETLHLTASTLSEMQNRVTEWLIAIDAMNENSNNNTMNIKLSFANHTLMATLVDNSSTRVLLDTLSKRDIVIEMSDYGNMEKVGPFGFMLPRNDEQITTSAGDLILYQGNSFVIYYAPNSWSFTRLGKINNTSQSELIELLGSGNLTVTLSLE